MAGAAGNVGTAIAEAAGNVAPVVVALDYHPMEQHSPPHWHALQKANRGSSRHKKILIWDCWDNLSKYDRNVLVVCTDVDFPFSYVVGEAVGVAFSFDVVLEAAEDDAFALRRMQYWGWEQHQQHQVEDVNPTVDAKKRYLREKHVQATEVWGHVAVVPL